VGSAVKLTGTVTCYGSRRPDFASRLVGSMASRVELHRIREGHAYGMTQIEVAGLRVGYRRTGAGRVLTTRDSASTRIPLPHPHVRANG